MKATKAFLGKSFFGAALYLFGFVSTIASPLEKKGETNPTPSKPTGDFFNQSVIHDFYKDGEFDSVSKYLSAFQASSKIDSDSLTNLARPVFSRSDSLFAAKYLGVVYAANPETREKGKYYLNLLNEISPTSNLAELRPSDEIYEIFTRIQEENESLRRSRRDITSTNLMTQDSIPIKRDSVLQVSPEPTLQTKSKINSWVWLAGVGGLAAAISAAYVLSDGGDNSPSQQATHWNVKVKVAEE